VESKERTAPREREAILVEERSVGSGGGCEEEEVEGGENPRNDTGTASAEPEDDDDDRSTSLGAPLEISHSEASPPAAHQTRGPEGGGRQEEASAVAAAAAAAEPPPILSHGAAATASASTLGAPGSLHAATRINSLASQRDSTPREEPVRTQEEPRGSAAIAPMEPSQAGGVRTKASSREEEEEKERGFLPLAPPPPPLPRCRRSQPCTPPRAVE